MVESCPDDKPESYLKDLARLLDWRLLALLLTESCCQAAYFAFTANCGYMVESIYHQSILTTALLMCVYGGLVCSSAWLSDQLQLGVLMMARIALSLMTAVGIISAALGIFFPDYLWAYLTGTFLQASIVLICLVSAQVLFVEPLADCAGMAASMEVLAQNLPSAVFSALATESMIFYGPRGLTLWQACACIPTGVVFWLGIGCCPPAWALPKDEERQGHKLARKRNQR